MGLSYNNPFKLTSSCKVIVDSVALGVIRSVMPNINMFEVVLINQYTEPGKAVIVRIPISRCIPCSLSSFILYGNGPISNFFKILETGFVGQ